MERSPAESRIFVKVSPAGCCKQSVIERVVLKKVVNQLRHRLVLTRPVAASNERFAGILVRIFLSLNGSAVVGVCVGERQVVRAPFN